MEKILSILILILAFGVAEVKAQNKVASPTCAQQTENCRNLSLTLDPTKQEPCSNCENTCSSAQKACFNEGDKTNLESASAHSLNCKQACKAQSSSSKSQ
jgi:hypothetical protein